MTLYEFNMLDEMEQAEVIGDAVCIDGRDDGEHLILLYQIDGFYVEMFYHRKYNAINELRSFECTEQLEPYLCKIDLDKALK